MGAGGAAAAPTVLGRTSSFSPAISVTAPAPDSPPGALPPLPPRPLSPTRSHWVPMRSGGITADDASGGGSGGGGTSPPRPTSAVPVPLASTGAVVAAVSMTEAAGQPPVPYRSRHEFLQSGKRIPTGCRPLSAFSTLSLSNPVRPGTALSSNLSTVNAGGHGNGNGGGCVVPLSESVAYQPVYQDEEGNIKTSFDVVDYFSTQGQNAVKKLFYLVARKPMDLMDVVSPFELVVVPFEKVDRSDYWTMSALGAVHVEGGRTEGGEFIPLGEWMRLNTVYGLLRKMRFFRHFLLVRTFRRWRANVKRTAFERTRSAVAARLFFVSPTFQPALMKAARLVQAMRDTAVVAITTRLDRLYTLEEFVGEQDNRRHSVAAPALTSLSEELAAEILAVGSRVASELQRMERGVDIGALRANEWVTHIPTGPGGPAHTAATVAMRSKSISALKAEKAAILAKYDAWVAAKTRMPQFVRLLDYLVACTAVDLGIRGTQELLSYLDNPAKTRGVLNVVVSFEPRNQQSPPPGSETSSSGSPALLGYSFAPKRRQVLEGLCHVMDALVSMLGDMPRPSSSKAVVAKYLSDRDTFVDVAALVVNGSQLYQHLRDGIVRHVETSFDRALEYVRATFEDKRPMYEFSLAWDAAAYDMKVAAAAIGLQGYDTLATMFRKDLLQQRRWQRQVDQMKMSNTVGILYVDSKKMRAALQDSIERTLEDIKCSVMSCARRGVAVGQETLKQWTKDMEPRPAELDGYAAMKELYSNLLVDQELAFKVVDAASDMYELYRDYGGKHDVKDAVALETLHETGAQVRAQLASLGAWVRERLPSMVTELAGAVQDLTSAIMLLLSDITSPALGDPDADVMDTLDVLAGLELKLLDVEDAVRRYTHYQELFGQPRDEPGNLPHVRREFDHRKAAWSTTAEWAERTSMWLNSPCASLDSEAITAAVDEYHRTAYRLARAARDDRVVSKLKDGIESFRRYSQVFGDACNSALQPHHWQQIMGLLGQKDRNPEDPITVSELIELGALDKAEPISNISAAASKEQSLRLALKRMQDDWVGLEFKMVPYKDTGTCVVGHTDEIQMQLDEQLMKIQAMNASPFVKPFKADAEAWQEALEGLEELLEQWLSCQATWMYLEPIFSSPDIVKQMPEEGAKFAQVDMTFRLLVDEVVASPLAIKLAKDSDRRDSLTLANRLLDEVQRGLSRYLEAKRLAFPRFFFLSNDEMLEILSETKDPTRVQPHLRKCFEGIHRLQFEPGQGGIVSAMISLEGEKVPFKQVINTSMARGKVEQWLVEVETAMFEAVHDVTGHGINDYVAGSGSGNGSGGGLKRHEWALRWPGMVVLLAAGVFWTRGVEEALAARQLQEYEKRCSSDLREIVDLVRGELTGLQRATLGALVVMDVHGRDVVSALAAEGVADAADFGWQAQLRSYWLQTDGKMVPNQPQRDWTARMCMMSASLEYGYEYLGNSSRLVITPLTDRCYRTLMGAIHLNLGGAPEGPAGTGKTETTKDLAKAMARQCVVFNCSDTLNHLDMAKFFKGLAAAGAWACFDEFNRIDLEVLSVVAQQVLDIQRAIAARLTVFTFEGTDLPLKWSAWCAITMNPGYAGRTELPDNLKALFRSVAMMVPDYAMIAEIILYSYGYLAARPAAKKIVACYKLCSEQLSSQDHYDYGMRAVMAVLRAAGNLKRTCAPSPESAAAMTPEQQETEELALVLRSIVDVNLCKFLSHDVPLFNGIVSDLFPGISLPRTDYGPLVEALRSACASANLQPTEYFMLKATQLYEMVLVRHGLMLVGQPFSGKTTAYRTLAAALTLVAENAAAAAAGGGAVAGESNPHATQVRTSTFVLNPKAVTMGQLYGQNDPASHEWTDGVLAVLFRRCAADPSPERKWLVLDGPVDAIWIENMNTVLDDNKKLCLNSGEIIAMSPPMNLIFEVGDLAVASPATVSRCGMVYLEPQQLGTAPLLVSWLATTPSHWSNVPSLSAAGSNLTGGLGVGGVGAAAAGVLGMGSSLILGGGGIQRSMSGMAGGGSTNTLGGELLSGVKARLAALYEGLVAPTIRFVRREVRECAPSLDGNLAISWMRLVSALLMPVLGTHEQYRKCSQEGRTMAIVDAVALMSLVWSAGCTAATQEGRSLVDSFIRRALSGTLAGLETPSGHTYGITDAPSVPLLSPAATPPETGTLYDFMYDVSAGSWVPWSTLAASAPPIPSDARFGAILVPTPDTAAVTFLLQTAINGKYPFLLVGPTGTGKSVTLTRCLLQLDGELFAPPNIIGFSGQTSANATQALVDAKLDKRRRGTYGPSGGRRGIVFVDDLNMPQREVYGAQPPIELLRQFQDHGGWYGRDNVFRNIQDVLLVTAMGPPGGGRDPVTNRFTRHFATLCLPEATRATLAHIFGTIQGWFLRTRGFPEAVVHLKDAVIAATLDVYSAAVSQLLPTPTKSHYTFNLRDCSRVIQGMQAQDADALLKSVVLMRPLIGGGGGGEANGGGGGSSTSGSSYASDGELVCAHLRLWVHEVLRVFYDRLVEVSEQQWLLNLLRDLVQKHFAVRLDELLAHLARKDEQPHLEAEGDSGAATEGSSPRRGGHGGNGSGGDIVSPETVRRCLFGDYMTDSDAEGNPRPYTEIPCPSDAVTRLEDLQADYNGMSGGGGGGLKQRLQLAVFLYAIEHVTRIARVLRQEGGHVLCVGVGGSGRRSLARLAAFISGMDAFQIEISRSYGLNEWREDLRRLTRNAGAAEKPTVFLFGDSQAAQEAFVEDVNSLINSGEVPNLFPHEERAAICEAVRAAARRSDPSASDSPAALWSFFVARCRANLHVVLCFSPAGDAFRERLRRFPSLVNCCTIDWFHAWPDDALDAVAAKLLTEVQLQPDERVRVKDLCKTFHSQAAAVSEIFRRDTGRHNYVTPTSFLELISCFGTLVKDRREKVLTRQQKYENGLDKLQFTAEQVTVMKNELQAMSPVLARTVAETEQLLSEIAREKEQVVEPKRALVDREVKQSDEAAAAAGAIKEECKAILSEALPALEAAIQALDTIKSADIKIVQTFKSPPAVVKLVLEAVCVLLDVKPTLLPDPNMPGRKIVDWWDASKRLLMDLQFIQRLKDYDRDNIPQRVIDKIRKEYAGDPDFTPANAAKASSAAEGLCKWVHAMDQYDRVAKVVAPKRAALAVAEAEYGRVLSGLHAKQAELRALEAKLAGLEAKLEESQKRKARLEADTQACALKLDRAEQLLGGLGGEKERWTQAASALRSQMGGVTGDMLLAAGAVAYLGAFTMPYRDRALAGWCEAVEAVGVRTSASLAGPGAASSSFSLTEVLGDPVTIRSWVIHGLPNDSFSIDSAVIAANSRRWPLCIDPQGQANRWIKAMNESKKIKVMKLTDPDYLRALETSISYGLPVLLENVGESLDPSLDPLLLRQTFKQGASLVLRLGDNLVEYSDQFRLYMTTALRNPHYLPETAVKVALLNFMITPEGLSDQLLGVAVAAEMPQLEEQRQTLVVASAENARQLAEIENRILAVMSTTEGNLLDDATAVGVLSEAKRLSNDISAKQAVAERTQAALDAARRRYRPVAEVAATVFFAIADLANVEGMYQYSLAWFIGLFVRSIQASAAESGGGGGGGGASSDGPADLGARLQSIERHFLYAAYCNVARSLFERHKLLLPFLLASRLAAHRGKLPPEQLKFLIQGGGAVAAAGTAGNVHGAAPEGIPARAWAEVLALSTLPGGLFTSLPTYIQQRVEQWTALVEASEPHSRPLPDPVDSMLGSFQRLLVIRCLRPDKLVPALEAWVVGELGTRFVSPPPLDLAAAFTESSSVAVPLLFVLSPGTDPWAALLRFAEEKEQAGKLQVISLGKGQGPRAEAMIDAARRMGSWVLLQNCHLAPSWMPSLERIWEAIREENTDRKFRLWLTSMPTTAFPPTLLQAAVKMTYEPPAGLRSNMRRSLALEPLSDHLFWELEGVGGPHSATAKALTAQQQQQQRRGSSEVGDRRRR
ncbi:hypothetical protein Vafri_18269 [Volvox africanus]|uniref:AAA+ ATPase domain-containing protein n=1 Tax=Volvox africanus TaxID=51714 RepID=A0A8J4BLN5_9CHLO|nr:hypothetical protein Vafri_18269 [Volvox africanus]